MHHKAFALTLTALAVSGGSYAQGATQKTVFAATPESQAYIERHARQSGISNCPFISSEFAGVILSNPQKPPLSIEEEYYRAVNDFKIFYPNMDASFNLDKTNKVITGLIRPTSENSRKFPTLFTVVQVKGREMLMLFCVPQP